jgi:RNA polymerase sigma factor FliA
MNKAAKLANSMSVDLDGEQRNQLLLEHLPQVQYIARSIHNRLPQHVLLEDLVHAGTIGLIDALQKFDPRKNVQLKHYAKFRIRGAILDSLRQLDWSPRTLRRRARQLEQAILNCKLRLGREPMESEIAAELQVNLTDLQQLVGSLFQLNVENLPGDFNVGCRSNEAFPDHAGAEEENPYYCTLRSEREVLLATAIDELPKGDREVLTLYDFKEFTMKEVGAMLGIGESRVSQIRTAALLRLRVRLQGLLKQRMPRGAACKA